MKRMKKKQSASVHSKEADGCTFDRYRFCGQDGSSTEADSCTFDRYRFWAGWFYKAMALPRFTGFIREG